MRTEAVFSPTQPSFLSRACAAEKDVLIERQESELAELRGLYAQVERAKALIEDQVRPPIRPSLRPI